MLIAFFVNDMAREFPNYTTTVLAHEAVQRGHRVCYITPGGDRFHNLGRGDCPSAIPEVKINRRNVGG